MRNLADIEGAAYCGLPLPPGQGHQLLVATPATPVATPAWPSKSIAAQLFSAVATPATPKRKELQNCALLLWRVGVLPPAFYCFVSNSFDLGVAGVARGAKALQ